MAYSESQIANIRQQFLSMDTDQNGVITKDEFNAIFTTSGRDPEDYEVEKFFSQADVDHDGQLSFQEFLAACESLGLTFGQQRTPSGSSSQTGSGSSSLGGSFDPKTSAASAPEPEEVDSAFRVFDKDGNGVITKSELAQVLAAQGEKLTDKELDDMIKAADRNGDGVIDKDEFRRMM